MPNQIPLQVTNEQFEFGGRRVEVRVTDQQASLFIDDKTYPLRFLKNGRPYTSAYVNVMAASVKDYAERFVSFTETQQKHWKAVNEARAKAASSERE